MGTHVADKKKEVKLEFSQRRSKLVVSFKTTPLCYYYFYFCVCVQISPFHFPIPPRLYKNHPSLSQILILIPTSTRELDLPTESFKKYLEREMETSTINNNKNNKGRSEEDVAVGFPVHSQVRRIKEESEGMIDGPTTLDRDVSRPLSRDVRRHRSRSPLGLSSSSSSSSGRPISVGD